MAAKISQREARRLRKRVETLEGIITRQRRTWSQEYVQAVQIASAIWTADQTIPTAVRTARKLGHAVVVIGDDTGELRFVALPHPAETV